MRCFKFQVLIFTLLTSCLPLSCKDEEDNELSGTLPVYIEEVFMPESGEVDQNIEIELHAVAPNGCFRDLNITMREIGAQHYLFRATGYYESAKVCPAGTVTGDSVIIFTPSSAGDFYFQTNEEPFPVRIDTLTVY